MQSIQGFETRSDEDFVVSTIHERRDQQKWEKRFWHLLRDLIRRSFQAFHFFLLLLLPEKNGKKPCLRRLHEGMHSFPTTRFKGRSKLARA